MCARERDRGWDGWREGEIAGWRGGERERERERASSSMILGGGRKARWARVFLDRACKSA